MILFDCLPRFDHQTGSVPEGSALEHSDDAPCTMLSCPFCTTTQTLRTPPFDRLTLCTDPLFASRKSFILSFNPHHITFTHLLDNRSTTRHFDNSLDRSYRHHTLYTHALYAPAHSPDDRTKYSPITRQSCSLRSCLLLSPSCPVRRFGSDGWIIADSQP